MQQMQLALWDQKFIKFIGFKIFFFLRTNNFEEYSGMNVILRNKYFNILKQHAITDISYF